ncbi:MAG: hypothetical protein ACOX6Y_04775 [Christensenellales bacterium]|jgi:hypothetical protein
MLIMNHMSGMKNDSKTSFFAQNPIRQGLDLVCGETTQKNKNTWSHRKEKTMTTSKGYQGITAWLKTKGESYVPTSAVEMAHLAARAATEGNIELYNQYAKGSLEALRNVREILSICYGFENKWGAPKLKDNRAAIQSGYLHYPDYIDTAGCIRASFTKEIEQD